jgi:hypothetical protein
MTALLPHLGYQKHYDSLVATSRSPSNFKSGTTIRVSIPIEQINLSGSLRRPGLTRLPMAGVETRNVCKANCRL